MPLDTSIPLQLKQSTPIESPTNTMARVLEIQDMRQQNALNQMKMQEAQTAIEERNRLRSTLNSFGADMSLDAQVNALAKAGFFNEARALAETSSKVGKEKRETEKLQADLAAGYIKQYRDLLPSVGSQDQYTAWRTELVSKLPGIAQMVPEQYSPETTRALMLDADKALKKHFITRDIGGAVDVLAIPEYGGGAGQVVPGSFAAKTATPGEVLSAQTQRRGQDITLRGQDMVNQRELDRLEFEKGKNSPEYIAKKAQMEEQGKLQAKFEATAPAAVSSAEEAINKIDAMIGDTKVNAKGQIVKGKRAPHPGFESAVGAGDATRFIPGSSAADFDARFREITGGAFLQAYETLKGGGAITEVEGQKATQAITRMSLSQSEGEFIKAAREFQEVLRKGAERAKARMGKGSSTATSSGATVSNW